MNRIAILIFSLIMTFAACEDKDDNNPETVNKNLVIKSGMICGWCGGWDTITIHQNTVEYLYKSPCNPSFYSKDTIIANSEWNKLAKELDLETFSNVNSNSCESCYDGCDIWILIENDTMSHYIKYGYFENSAIDPIRPFVSKLDSIRNYFRDDATDLLLD